MATKTRTKKVRPSDDHNDPARRLRDHDGLAWYVARRYARAAEVLGIELEDVFQTARMGILRAHEDYDPARGKFATYAVQWMQAFIQRDVICPAGIIRVPVHAQQRGAKPNVKALAAAVANVDSLDREMPNGARGRTATVGSLVQSNAPSAPEQLEEHEEHEALRKALRGLPVRWQTVLLGHAEGRTFADVGTELGCSRERVRQLQNEAIAVLRLRMGATR